MNEDLVVEIEALEAVFDSISISGRSIRVPVYPSTADDVSRRYVEATLCFLTDADYPSRSPEVTLASSRGLGEQRQEELLGLLRNEAEQLKGELVMGHLCEVT